MYIVEYFKTSGAVIQLEVSNTRELRIITTSLLDKITSGTVISFNVEVIDTNISMGK